MTYAQLDTEENELLARKSQIGADVVAHQNDLTELNNRVRGRGRANKLPQGEYASILRDQARHRQQLEALVGERGQILTRTNAIRRLKADIRGLRTHEEALYDGTDDDAPAPTSAASPLPKAPKAAPLSSPSAKASDAPAGTVASLVALRDEYQRFAADASRVASCRRMASEFTVKLTLIIKEALKP